MTCDHDELWRPERAAVAVIRKGEQFLGIKRAENIRAAGKVCFPGGGIESGETVEDAVVREIREELGIQIRPIKQIWKSTTPWSVEVNWVLAEYVVGEIYANSKEVEWCRWMTVREFVQSPDLLVSNAVFFDALRMGEFVLE